MQIWHCAAWISGAGALGGLANALNSGNGFALPRRIEGVWCPGAISTVLLRAFAAFASWAFYGSGAVIDLAKPEQLPHFQLSAVAGAFLIGVIGSKWLTNESDKLLLRESVNTVTAKMLPGDEANRITSGPPLKVLKNIKEACDECITLRIPTEIKSN
jgi:hypothetical protein